jgi:hypothetical protein
VTGAGQVAIVLGVLALVAGGSLTVRICLFYAAAKAETSEARGPGRLPTARWPRLNR